MDRLVSSNHYMSELNSYPMTADMKLTKTNFFLSRFFLLCFGSDRINTGTENYWEYWTVLKTLQKILRSVKILEITDRGISLRMFGFTADLSILLRSNHT